ncbi:MAG TPA: methyltransferase domain-containing protein [Candidatus Eisenbacteria bacterium]|nr:methyltransferase domain-containing protein [Candidatus Eisenbacteria bacterium]
MDSRHLVREQFGRSARAYATSDVHARGDSLTILLEFLAPAATWQALDVATGAGHTACAIAPHVAHVVATDITPEMLAETARLARERELANVDTRLADAEALPFADASFDLVTCRLAFHHFPHPATAMREFARVLRPQGTLGFADNIAVEDPAGARAYNDYERLRDPSHHEVLPFSRLVALVESAGLHVEATRTFAKEFEFGPWADRMHVGDADKAHLLQMLRDLPASARPLLAPRFADDGTAWFSLWETALVARRLE